MLSGLRIQNFKWLLSTKVLWGNGSFFWGGGESVNKKDQMSQLRNGVLPPKHYDVVMFLKDLH